MAIALARIFILAIVLLGIFLVLSKVWRKIELTSQSKEKLEEQLIKIENQVKLAEEIKDFKAVKKLDKSKQAIQYILKKGAQIK